MNAQAVSAGAQALTILVYLTTITAWAALAVFLVFLKRMGKGAGRERHAMMLIWLVLACVWLGVASGLRLFANYTSPTVQMSLSRSVVDLVGYAGILGIFTARLWQMRKRGRS